MISTKNLKLLPNQPALQQLCKAISVCDAIISPEWEYRYYSYQEKWAKDEEFFEMRDGQGDQMLILFRPDGCVINGFAHELYDYEAELPAKSKLTHGLPDIYKEFIFGEPVKTIGTTFCIWTNDLSTNSQQNWQIGDCEHHEDGSKEMLYLFDGKPQTYVAWACEYFEAGHDYKQSGIPLKTVADIYAGKTLTKAMVLSIVDDVEDWAQLEADLQEINYPYQF